MQCNRHHSTKQSFLLISVKKNDISMMQNIKNFTEMCVFTLQEAAEFDDIPRNMQALSESIQERDRYIFGDRPRQRVHTGDFTQVNWH